MPFHCVRKVVAGSIDSRFHPGNRLARGTKLGGPQACLLSRTCRLNISTKCVCKLAHDSSQGILSADEAGVARAKTLEIGGKFERFSEGSWRQAVPAFSLQHISPSMPSGANNVFLVDGR